MVARLLFFDSLRPNDEVIVEDFSVNRGDVHIRLRGMSDARSLKVTSGCSIDPGAKAITLNANQQRMSGIRINLDWSLAGASREHLLGLVVKFFAHLAKFAQVFAKDARLAVIEHHGGRRDGDMADVSGM